MINNKKLNLSSDSEKCFYHLFTCTAVFLFGIENLAIVDKGRQDKASYMKPEQNGLLFVLFI